MILIVLPIKFAIISIGMRIKNEEEKLKAKIKNWLYDHIAVKTGLEWFKILIVSTISALFFAFGFNCFMDVSGQSTINAPSIVSGGISGVSQVFVLFFELCGWKIQDTHLAVSIMYFAFNAPLFVLAFFKIGKRFAIFTAINVAEVSLFIKLLNVSSVPAFGVVFNFVTENGGGLLGRALFGGICIGLSSALAFFVDISAGGIDVIATAIAIKKNTLVGKYSALLNGITLTCYTLLSMALANWEMAEVGSALARAFYSLLYLLTCSLVVDKIHLRNKKVKIEIVSSNKETASLLIEAFPHGATMVDAKGVFSGKSRYVITMVVSNSEVKPLINLIRKEDPTAFVQVIPLIQVYGRFHIQPIK